MPDSAPPHAELSLPPCRIRSRDVVPALARLFTAAALVLGCASDAVPPTGVPRTGPVAPPSANVANVVPTAQFAVSPRWPAPGDTVTFDARYSHDNDGQVVQYRWVMSNGVTQSTGAIARTVFRTAGTYTVTLTALDDRGDSSTTTLSLPVTVTGTPAGAVSATQSDLSLASGSVGGGAGVVATVIARTAAGISIPGATTGVSVTGRRVSATPITGTANGSGVFTSTLSSPVAQSVVVRAVANFTALTDTVPLTVTPAPAATVSAVRLTQSALASSGDSAFLEVTARDTAGNPIPGIAVSVSGSPGGMTVANEGTTDANGRRVITLKTSVCDATHTLTVVAGGVTLSAAPTLQSGVVSAYTICGPTVWLDANTFGTFTIESATRITQWRDRSGNGLHASAASGTSARPQYTATSFNGRPAVSFAGGLSGTSTPEHLSLAGFPAQGLSAVTYFVVYSRTADTACSRIFDFGSNTTAYAFYTAGCFGQQRYGQTTSGAGGEILASTTEPTNGVGQMLTIVHSGAATTRLNGANAATSAAIPAPNAIGTPTNRWLGRSQYSHDGYLSGQIAEFIAFPRALNNLEWTAVEHALMRKWGLGTVTITQGNNQSTVAGTSPTSQLVFRVADAQGNGISGAQLVLQVTTGGSRLSGGTTLSLTTDSNGNASVPTGTWVLDYGTNVLTLWYSTTAGQGQSIAVTGTGTLPGSLWMQYDASNASTLYRSSTCAGTLAAPGDSVGCWMDATSGNPRHVTQATAGYRPTVSTFGSTGRNAVQFVRTRENYLQSTATGLGTLANGPRTIVAVARSNTSEDNSTNAGSAIVVFPGNHSGLHFWGNPTSNSIVAAQWTSTGALLWSDRPYTANTALVASQVMSTAGGNLTNTVTINGTSSATTTATSATSLAYGDNMRFGQANVAPSTDNRWRLDGQIAEVMVFNAALSNSDRLQVERYLGWKWGVTIP